MKIAMINGSPKPKHNTTQILLDEFAGCLTKGMVIQRYDFIHPQLDDDIMKEINSCDVLVLASPLYVDALPSHFLSCLCQMEKSGMTNQNMLVYGIMNCGFYEGRQNMIAIQIMKNWCQRVNLNWGMGIGVGGGGALIRMESIPFGEGPKRFLGNALCTLKLCLESKTQGEDQYVSINVPRGTYKMTGEDAWREIIKANGGDEKDLGFRYK